jgi:hypothetical protein
LLKLMFAVLYRWRIKAGTEEQFVDDSERVTPPSTPLVEATAPARTAPPTALGSAAP